MNIVFFNCSLGNFLGGYVFGLKMGTFLTFIGCMLAAMVSFYISRDLLKEFFTITRTNMRHLGNQLSSIIIMLYYELFQIYYM